MKTVKLKQNRWVIIAGLIITAISCMVLIRQLLNQYFMHHRQVSEKEIVAFVLTQNHTRGNPETEELFIFADKTSDDQQDSFMLVDRRRPKRAWLYKNEVLTEQEDAEEAVQEFLGGNWVVSPPKTYTYFAILSISLDGKSAKVAVEHTCGGTCGTGKIYSLKRDWSGQWQNIKTEMVWIS